MKKSSLLWVLCLVCLCISCNKPKKVVEFSFSAKLEQPFVEEDSSQKNYLTSDETFIRWEEGDAIAIDGETKNFPLIKGEGTDTAQFMGAYTEKGSGNRYALYPFSSKKDDGITTLNFPAEQPYRAGDAKYDQSFGINSFPMVATFKDGDESVLFHSVSSMMRIQLYAADAAEITQISFVECSTTPLQISGTFDIHDIDKNAPYLTPTLTGGSVTDAAKTITITGIDKSIGPNTLLTFYLVLPALTPKQGSETWDAYKDRTHLKLQMTVNATVNGSPKTFVKTFGGNVARNRITPIPALYITGWSDGEPANSADIKLVGNGTVDRPFIIYDEHDLIEMRDAFNAVADVDGDVYINGQKVTDDTRFQLGRATIVLTTSNWSVGIKKFRGVFEAKTNNPINFGITNRSNAPVFESILANSQVAHLYIRYDSSGTHVYEAPTDYSPLCRDNYGILRDCHNRSNIRATSANLAGICVNNHGLIIKCQNQANLTANNKNVAGLCLTNYDSITQCVGVASAKYSGAKFGGICLENRGKVIDCIAAYNNNIDSVNITGCGCIAYKNCSGAEIIFCRVSGDLRLTNHEEIGGIVDINEGLVDSCFLVEVFAVLKGGKVGGIASIQQGASACVRNCYVTNRIFCTAIGDGGYGAGIVGYLNGGNVENCYSQCNITGLKIAAIFSQGISGKVSNCYAYGSPTSYGVFYRLLSDGVILDCCYSNEGVYPAPRANGSVTVYDGETFRVGGTSFLMNNLNTWVSSQAESEKYANWFEVMLPHFNY